MDEKMKSKPIEKVPIFTHWTASPGCSNFTREAILFGQVVESGRRKEIIWI
jgi:hypothetical protein